MDRPVDQPESPLEILRRMENIVRTGTIAEVRHGRPARCRVRCGNITTNWIPWVAGRAAGTNASVWWPPKVGEQCLMLAPGGDLLNAMALPGAYSDKNPQGHDNPDLFRMDWGLGHMEYDSKSGEFTLVAKTCINLRVVNSSIQIMPESILIESSSGSLVIDERGVTASPDVFVGTVSLKDHVHAGVRRGDSTTDEPQP